jgi:ATP-binding cassette subfamily B protein/ATP-binding cassette subfamily C protein
VSQEVHLFSASSAGQPDPLFDGRVGDDRLREAIETLGLGGWLRGLPDGLDTLLGPGGSGSRRVRPRCWPARGSSARSDVVILDEASSRWTPRRERLVHEALGRLLRGRTGIIVAHRLATIAYADDVLVLEEGECAGSTGRGWPWRRPRVAASPGCCGLGGGGGAMTTPLRRGATCWA